MTRGRVSSPAASFPHRRAARLPSTSPGVQHAGENVADVLKQRARELRPAIQMGDALSWSAPKLPPGVELRVANCLARGRRQLVEVAQNFPAECGHVLEQLGEVYRNKGRVPTAPSALS